MMCWKSIVIVRPRRQKKKKGGAGDTPATPAKGCRPLHSHFVYEGVNADFHYLLTSCLSLSLTGCPGREPWTSDREGAVADWRLMRIPVTSTSSAATASTPNNSACGRLIPKRISSE